MGDPEARYARRFLDDSIRILQQIDDERIDVLAGELRALRDHGGRLFIIGNGGGAGHASHAVNDFRKLAGIESYSPSDNVSELTARVNDDGWDRTYADWLHVSRLSSADMLLVLSVGGGDVSRNISPNIVRCLELAGSVGARIAGIVGRDGGATSRLGHTVVVVPSIDPSTVTAQTEGMQAVLWHLLVSHPLLRLGPAKWEAQG